MTPCDCRHLPNPHARTRCRERLEQIAFGCEQLRRNRENPPHPGSQAHREHWQAWCDSRVPPFDENTPDHVPASGKLNP